MERCIGGRVHASNREGCGGVGYEQDGIHSCVKVSSNENIFKKKYII